MSDWLNTVFASFDFNILQFIHETFAVGTNGALNMPMRLISLLADEGLGMILIGLILCCFRRTRRVGCTVLAAIVVGALITNVTVKNLVARPRPFADATHVFYDWWQYAGASHVSEYSFPSGHTTSAMAAMGAIFLCTNKKYSWTALLFALLMGFTRMYLVVHYPTDVIGGLLSGAIGAVAAFYLIKLGYAFVHKHEDWRLCRFFLDFDLATWAKKLFKKEKTQA